MSIKHRVFEILEASKEDDRLTRVVDLSILGITTLTTVGYGDTYPVTPLGKILASAIAVMGIGLFALPAGILGSAFVEDLQARKKHQSASCPHCGKELEAAQAV